MQNFIRFNFRLGERLLQKRLNNRFCKRDERKFRIAESTGLLVQILREDKRFRSSKGSKSVSIINKPLLFAEIQSERAGNSRGLLAS